MTCTNPGVFKKLCYRTPIVYVCEVEELTPHGLRAFVIGLEDEKERKH